MALNWATGRVWWAMSKRREPKKYRIWERDKETAQVILNEMTLTYERQLNGILTACNALVREREATGQALVDEIWERAKAEVGETRQKAAKALREMRRWREQAGLLAQENVSLSEQFEPVKQALAAISQEKIALLEQVRQQAHQISILSQSLADTELALAAAQRQALPVTPRAGPAGKDIKRAGGKNGLPANTRPKKRPNQRHWADED